MENSIQLLPAEKAQLAAIAAQVKHHQSMAQAHQTAYMAVLATVVGRVDPGGTYNLSADGASLVKAGADGVVSQ